MLLSYFSSAHHFPTVIQFQAKKKLKREGTKSYNNFCKPLISHIIRNDFGVVRHLLRLIMHQAAGKIVGRDVRVEGVCV